MKGVMIALFITLMPVTASTAPESMNLLGSGEARYLGFIKVYDAELYAHNAGETDTILSPDVSKCLKLTYHVALKPKDFIKGATLVLKRQLSAEQFDLIVPEVKMLHEAYAGVAQGDSYNLCYDAATARTSLSLNGNELVVIESRQFSESYFGIWLAPEQPLSVSLRKQLLGAATEGKPEVGVNG